MMSATFYCIPFSYYISRHLLCGVVDSTDKIIAKNYHEQKKKVPPTAACSDILYSMMNQYFGKYVQNLIR